ncbi:MAG: CPBP family intramembrane metalloprotease [Anaerolineae bacterium]|jgi:membrane protease YdiL (CAAX protease family)|nr:CPBP family intramembrane metalloprotease [Anaerolineae bacterium]
MALLWQALYALAMGSFVWLLHTGLGRYPEPLPRSENPKREIREVLLLWGAAVIVPILRVSVLTPLFDIVAVDRTLRELISVPLLSVPYLALPLFVVVKRNGWTVDDLGLTWRRRSEPGSRPVAIAAVLFGLVSGVTAFVTSETVMGAEVLPAGVFVLLLYTNSFLEEFTHRGVLQSKLERAVGQRKAILWGGMLFGLTHVALDISRLLASEGIPSVLFALLLQTIGGWLLGIVYMKTRSLWPGVVCHYLVNWLPGVLVGLTS